jgi:hypothetical protein
VLRHIKPVIKDFLTFVQGAFKHIPLPFPDT